MRANFTEDGGENKPWLLYLQGGPVERNPTSSHSGWMAEALKHYRVLMLDQRGTGLSTPINRHTLIARGRPADQARYLTHFRAWIS